MLIGSALLFALVIGLFFLSLFSRKLAHVPASRWIIGGGIVMPIPVLTVLLGAAFLQGETLFGARAAAPSDVIQVKASMWNWDIRYGAADASPSSRNVLHIPAGQTVEVVVSSTDVIHSFWVPRLAGKIDRQAFRRHGRVANSDDLAVGNDEIAFGRDEPAIAVDNPGIAEEQIGFLRACLSVVVPRDSGHGAQNQNRRAKDSGDWIHPSKTPGMVRR